MPDAKTSEFEVRVERESGPDLPAPEGANYFQFAYAGGEVQFLVGAVDLTDIHQLRTGGKGGVVRARTTHRFLLSMQAFTNLRAQIDDIAGKIEKPKLAEAKKT